jgi:putative addiction module killer protein
MFDVQRTRDFNDWIEGLRDVRAVARIAARIDYLVRGALGDVKSVGGGVSELRIDYGPGYRVYFTRRGTVVVLLLCGGDKSSQDRDIKRARQMVKEL